MNYVKNLALRMIFGKYSYIYQSNIVKSGHTLAKNINYLNPCSKLDALNHYRPAVADNKKDVEFVTTKKIEFQNIPFNASFRLVKKRNRKPSCYDIHKYQDHYWRRLGYRERIFNTGVRMIFHFLNKRFFFGEIFFSDSSKVKPEIVALSLLKKYTDEKEAPKTNFKIKGKNAFIFFENTGINLSIKYIYTGNEIINSNLQSIDNFSPFAKAEQTDDLDDIL